MLLRRTDAAGRRELATRNGSPPVWGPAGKGARVRAVAIPGAPSSEPCPASRRSDAIPAAAAAAARSAGPRRPGPSEGSRCGLVERSSSPSSPSTRNRFTHFEAVWRLTGSRRGCLGDAPPFFGYPSRDRKARVDGETCAAMLTHRGPPFWLVASTPRTEGQGPSICQRCKWAVDLDRGLADGLLSADSEAALSKHRNSSRAPALEGAAANKIQPAQDIEPPRYGPCGCHMAHVFNIVSEAQGEAR
jgi:hypothetical protein